MMGRFFVRGVRQARGFVTKYHVGVGKFLIIM